MVSRVYTPPVLPYTRPHGAGSATAAPQNTPTATEENRQATQQAPIPQESGDFQRPSNGLQSVQYNQFQKIPLDAVLNDFQNTMTALGADEKTQSEVTAYLKVVSLQGAKEQPEVPFIKHTLRTAAGTLDQFISNALGQPSKVVKEWVDALLMQNIEYHSDKPLEEILPNSATNAAKGNATATTTDNSSTAASDTMTAPQKAQLKSLIETAMAAQKTGNGPDADAKLQTALDQLQNADHPEWEGKIWRLRGRFADQSGDWQKAVSAYDTASQKFADAQLPGKQSDTLHAMASILEDHGQLENAKGYYQQVVGLDSTQGDIAGQVRGLNDLGRVELRLGQADDAIQTLEKAASLRQQANLPPQAGSDILSNLGAAYRKANNLSQSANAYKQAAQAAKDAQDKDRYIQSLQQYAGVLIEGGKPVQAMKALQKLSTLTNTV
jgi:tetratricopeptide (TPR) repeat protein